MSSFEHSGTLVAAKRGTQNINRTRYNPIEHVGLSCQESKQRMIHLGRGKHKVIMIPPRDDQEDGKNGVSTEPLLTLAEKPSLGRAGEVAEFTIIETEEVHISVGEADAASREEATASGKQVAVTPTL